MCPYRFLYLTAEVQSASQLCRPHSRAVYDTRQHINSSLRLLELISQPSWDFTPNQIAFVIFIVGYCFCFSGLFMGIFSRKWVISYKKPTLVNTILLGMERIRACGEKTEHHCVRFGLVHFGFALAMELAQYGKFDSICFSVTKGCHNFNLFPYHVDCCLLPEALNCFTKDFQRRLFLSVVTLLAILTIWRCYYIWKAVYCLWLDLGELRRPGFKKGIGLKRWPGTCCVN